jgi:hypothetical protein
MSERRFALVDSPHWMPPSIFRPPEVLTEAEVIEAEVELKALQPRRRGFRTSGPFFRMTTVIRRLSLRRFES